MTDDALRQFREQFGCWVTDHGLTGADDGEVIGGDVKAYVNLPKLEAAIEELLAAAVGRDLMLHPLSGSSRKMGRDWGRLIPGLLWTGWAPGFWPVHDKFDPRGFRWADPLAGP